MDPFLEIGDEASGKETWGMRERLRPTPAYSSTSLLLALEVFVGRIFITVDLHVSHVPLLWCCCLIYFHETLKEFKIARFRKQIISCSYVSFENKLQTGFRRLNIYDSRKFADSLSFVNSFSYISSAEELFWKKNRLDLSFNIQSVHFYDVERTWLWGWRAWRRRSTATPTTTAAMRAIPANAKVK